jgi:DNA-directed RNA polymerase specialized sigma24 family protein
MTVDDVDLREVIAAADKAAQEGRAWDAVHLLFTPAVLKRMRGRLRGAWNWITDDEIDDAITEAFLAFYVEIRRGGQITKTVPWLANVAWRKAADSMRRTEVEDVTDPDTIEISQALKDDPDKTAAAFNHFERLVGRLSPDGVKRVMEIVVEAIKTGIPVLTNAMIAEALGEHPENVKKWRQRGFEKLGRLARVEGLVDETFRLTDVIFDDPDEEED